MKFLFDNNLPHPIASALRILQKSVQHVRDIPELGAAAPDELILSYAGQRGFVLVTRNRGIHRTPQYRAIIKEARIKIVLRSGSAEWPREAPRVFRTEASWQAIRSLALGVRFQLRLDFLELLQRRAQVFDDLRRDDIRVRQICAVFQRLIAQPEDIE